MTKNKGKVIQIVSVVVDVQFELDVPNIYHALEAKTPSGDVIVLEVQQLLGDNMNSRG